MTYLKMDVGGSRDGTAATSVCHCQGGGEALAELLQR